MGNQTLPGTLSKSVYDALDPHIRPLVLALHQMEVRTVGSCEGHVDEIHKSHVPFCAIDIAQTPQEALNFLKIIIYGYNILRAGKAPWKFIEVPGYFYGDETYLAWKLMPDEENMRSDPRTLEELWASVEDLVRFIGAAQVVDFL
ncbi:MAG: hypothetical protein A3E07_01085 [Candidatus Wildermuthbacteria bacterium RIFCSPHIGHO2_12_FULL_45_9]|uniref:Uncharacterized protein n=1 Tax=Candidatus Wildermuthbacteria bacterium RIFCSPHIGHO2_02_FULL_45_25 TaxID=1802450 RepID=A0A1G2QYN7_9BACT|nr:MAG: hypothetical protein A2748_02030 [Candidatus Wildermuthbacteria bacterium RIFCSPHIGHO2_01_FULL_45_20]OHA65700.1 MAG: hypothetical protein A3C04_02175 [Candidatus Wildermuthbacteria bacterium RIFCSPHIGHO2_02_FULL_45_25]OHA70255.1 MAG: hypothetical protein A3E07_01085 [Candidatus Wildermuthbacteria bacterium RIFCSPHIGHO2_12_FULL_45_9]